MLLGTYKYIKTTYFYQFHEEVPDWSCDNLCLSLKKLAMCTESFTMAENKYVDRKLCQFIAIFKIHTISFHIYKGNVRSVKIVYSKNKQISSMLPECLLYIYTVVGS